MILLLIEDLLFRSKISAACKAAGVNLSVAKTPEEALAIARESLPALVVLDLDGHRTRPLELVAQLQADATLAHVPTLGFVSHVRADVIREARRVGVGEVLARGAFSTALPELLSRFESGAPPAS